MVIKPIVIDQAEWFFATTTRDVASPTFYGVFQEEPKVANEGMAYFVKKDDAEKFSRGY